ncbi:hypothetical protein LEP1GSC050_3270 [Leptospira broomii serovar Hurstbridge str. 5399]|uniref:Uncharacterized protein n=1 Tax=Leptospira broomii serovar Hurstbridge str. 5399 TaxID=1049789 RepID=T0GBN4_9LEPT|nr:hypothetical protein [Leptospira broomii]EQA44219.1 hypothetical protein LEP1GSC050_3270 [Leptospira broomii serovar Hurstbridge str. 5399]
MQVDDGKYIRVWKKMSVSEVTSHLLIIDDLYGTCGNCKHLGLNYTKDRSCPKCGSKFKYLATNLKAPGEIAKVLARIEKEGMEFILIDREDYTQSKAKDAVKDLFKSTE